MRERLQEYSDSSLSDGSDSPLESDRELLLDLDGID
jgi:hypothetical protein